MFLILFMKDYNNNKNKICTKGSIIKNIFDKSTKKIIIIKNVYKLNKEDFKYYWVFNTQNVKKNA